jgi:uncharacterized coiled-coil protein SlyX
LQDAEWVALGALLAGIRHGFTGYSGVRAGPSRAAGGGVVDDRIAELEVRIAFQDKLLAELDDVIRALRDELDGVRARLDLLEEQVRPDLAQVVDERPPHY